MLCKKCNYENDAAAKFCENCGANLQAKSPVQTNKGLKKIIWGCIGLLYVLVIVVFFMGLHWRELKYQDINVSTQEEYSMQFNPQSGLNTWRFNSQSGLINWQHFEFNTLDPTWISLLLLSSIVLIIIVLLLFSRKLKLSFGINAILMSIYAAIGASTPWSGAIVLFIVFFAAAITILIYKYSFAENQKLL